MDLKEIAEDRNSLRVGISRLITDFESANPDFQVGNVEVVREYSRVVGGVVTRVNVEVELR